MSYKYMQLLQSDRITYIRNSVYNQINLKSKEIPHQTLDSLRSRYKKNINSKVKLIKLYNDINQFSGDVKSFKDIKQIQKNIKEMNSKIKSTIEKRKSMDKKALGEIFKKSFITEDLEYPLPFIFKRIENQLLNEFDKNNKKYNLIAYIVFQYEVYKKESDGSIINYIHSFHSDTMFITSKKIFWLY